MHHIMKATCVEVCENVAIAREARFNCIMTLCWVLSLGKFLVYVAAFDQENAITRLKRCVDVTA